MATLRTVTVKSSGGDYTSLHTALSTEATDITLATGTDEILRFDLYPMEDTTRVQITNTDGWVTSSGNYVELRVVDSGGAPVYTSTWSTSIYRLVNDSGGSMQAFRNGGINHLWHTAGTLQLYTGDVSSTADNDGVIEFKGSLGSGFQRLDGGGIIVLDCADTGSHLKGVKIDNGTPTGRMRNWIIYGGETSQPTDYTEAFQFAAGAAGAAWVLDNCTFDDITTGIGIWTGSDVDLQLRNCRITNVSNVVAGNSGREIAADSDYNLTDDASAPTNWGANSITSATLDYVDASNATLTSRDYRLNSNADSGYEAGDDLSADFTVDIENTTRTVTWDIGAHELSAGGGPSAPSGVTVSNATTSSLDVSWTDNTGGTDDHRVYWRQDGGVSWNLFSTVSAGTTSETVTGLTDNTTYDIAVAAFDGVDESVKVVDSGTTTDATPDPPVGVTVTTFTDTTATLSWSDPNGGSANPRMYKRTPSGSGSWTFVTQLATSATSYQFTGLTEATQYDLGVSYI